jgi:dihydrofolate reductase
MKVTYYVASSIDGYIAEENGDVSWLEEFNIPPEENGYEAFFSTVDALVMGRRTFEVIYRFGVWPYGDKPVWVCTNSNVKSIEGANHQRDTSPEGVIEAAHKMGVAHLWLVGGGSLAASFIDKSLLTNISVAQMPIILGNGIHLFGTLANPTLIELKGCQTNASGFLQIEYETHKCITKHCTGPTSAKPAVGR